jgi:hypothetical protein
VIDANSVETMPPTLADRLITRNALRDMPKPEPLIDNVLDQGTVALLYGHWGTYKSFVALDWAASVATGRAWQGRDVQRRRALYVAAEGAFGLSARVNAWESGWGTLIGDQDLVILPEPVNLTAPAEVNGLIELIEWAGYGFVVLDTLARCMVGGEENSARDCGVVIDVLTRLRAATPGGKGCVTGVHHTGKDAKTFRGSSAFEAGADTVYSCTVEDGTVTLNREKRKDGPPDDTHKLRLQLIGDSGVMAAHHIAVDRGERANLLLMLFVTHFALTGASSADLKAVALDVGGMSRATYFRARDALLQSGDLISVGTYHRPFYRVSETFHRVSET